MKVCQLCDDKTPENSSIGRWMLGVREFWRNRPFSLMLFQVGYILLLGIAVLCTLINELQDYVAVPLAAFVVLYVLSEYVPMSPMPLNNINAVSSTGPMYTGTMSVITHAVVLILFFSFLLELLNSTSTEAVVKRVISISVLVAPVVGLTYILVRQR